MSWQQIKEPQKNEMFVSIKEYKHRRGMKVGVYGAPEVGKTHFACSFPEPIYVVDTEFGCYPVARKFDKEIHIAEVLVINEETDEVDVAATLDRVEDVIRSLKDVKEGTIVIDSGTDIWQWIGAWLEDTAVLRSKQTGKMLQLEWARGNERYRKLLLPLLSKPVHFVITAHHRMIYDASGRPLGIYEPAWQKQTPYWVDLVVNLRKSGSEGGIKYHGIIEKFRYSRASNIQLMDTTYDGLTKLISEKFNVKFAEK